MDVAGQSLSNSLTLSGTGVSGYALVNSSAGISVTLTGNVLLAGDSTLNITNNLAVSGSISGGYALILGGNGSLTLSAINTYTGGTVIGSNTLILGTTNALPSTGIVSINGGVLDTAGYASVTGPLNLVNASLKGQGSLSATSFLATGAQLLLGASVTVPGSINLNIPVQLIGDVTLQSTGGAVMVSNTIDNANIAGSNARDAQVGYQSYNLTLIGATNVTISADVGATRRIYEFLVQAPVIYLNADVTTGHAQIYNGSTLIGDTLTEGHNFTLLTQDLVKTTGYQTLDIHYVSAPHSYLIRTLVSQDPSITFNGSVDDAIPNSHTLVTLAIGLPNTPAPTVRFNGAVGGASPLYAFTAMTLQYRSGVYSNDGSVTLDGPVTTQENQTYFTRDLIFNGTTPTLNSSKGIITINANSVVSGTPVTLNYYSATEQPSITIAAGASSITTRAQVNPTELNAATFEKEGYQKTRGSSDDQMRHELTGEVTLEPIEVSQEPLKGNDKRAIESTVTCDPNKDVNCRP